MFSVGEGEGDTLALDSEGGCVMFALSVALGVVFTLTFIWLTHPAPHSVSMQRTASTILALMSCILNLNAH